MEGHYRVGHFSHSCQVFNPLNTCSIGKALSSSTVNPTEKIDLVNPLARELDVEDLVDVLRGSPLKDKNFHVLVDEIDSSKNLGLNHLDQALLMSSLVRHNFKPP